jgi:hypothetical protein
MSTIAKITAKTTNNFNIFLTNDNTPKTIIMPKNTIPRILMISGNGTMNS